MDLEWIGSGSISNLIDIFNFSRFRKKKKKNTQKSRRKTQKLQKERRIQFFQPEYSFGFWSELYTWWPAGKEK